MHLMCLMRAFIYQLLMCAGSYEMIHLLIKSCPPKPRHEPEQGSLLMDVSYLWRFMKYWHHRSYKLDRDRYKP